MTLQHCRVMILALSKRGSLTLPPELRRKLGLDKLERPMLLVEERDGGLFLRPTVELPVREIPKVQLRAWIARDQADLSSLRRSRNSTNR